MKLTDVLMNRRQHESVEPGSKKGWSEEVQAIPIRLLSAGKYQPRQIFDEENIQELAESIKVHGLLQPIVVRRGAVGYEIVVGERRLRACTALGWEVIPAIVRNVEDKDAAELGLIENLQRSDLGLFEIAEGYARLLNEFQITQEDLAERLGISQANVANKVRLLRLPERVREVISREMLSERHARALLRVSDHDMQFKLLARICEENLNVKQTEQLIAEYLAPQQDNDKGKEKPRQKRKLIIKDLRLFTNSIKELTATLKAGGLKVDMDEKEDDDVFQIIVTVKKPQGGGKNNG
ncbi:MAG: ParB/RepB/Spo0J family partition protein [Bacillota bacterium]|nr:ParB/RepB/Spo0J family partition protein [Bacillota bacterium]HHU61227.1 ParB/RepB/Spo0J family partition protein [Natronincola sp.]